jgi:hypothetical protein
MTIMYADAVQGAGPGIIAPGEGNLLHYYDGDTSQRYALITGVDFAELTCALLLLNNADALREHPVGAWNISYPYARTSLRIRMDDPKPDLQVAQLAVVQRYLFILVTAVDSDNLPVSASVTASIEPDQLYPCSADLYRYFTQGTMLLAVDANYVMLPARILFEITDLLGHQRRAWIGLRNDRAGVPSGAVL